MRSVPVTTYSLEMLSRSEFRPRHVADPDFRIIQVTDPCPEFNRFLYCAVGWPWYWVDKLGWSYEQWEAYVARPQLETWVGYWQGAPGGYFELEQQPGDNVELAYFGLLPHITGRGLGGHLLTVAIERAWERGAQRVWVHTCTLDHAAALANYKARGFRVYHEETASKIVPDTPQRNWP